MEPSVKKFKVALIGATGAVGKEIVKHASQDPRIEELCLVVRKRAEEWKDEDFQCKLKIIAMENFDDMSSLVEELQGYDSFLCTLGSLTKYGEEAFRRVDFTYPLEFAKIAQQVGAPHYGLLSSKGAKASSCFLYMKVKGEVENAVEALKIFSYYIYRPGFLLNRDDSSRPLEKIFTKVPFIDKIACKDVGKIMLEKALNHKVDIKSEAPNHKFLLKNSDLKRQIANL
ncbi:UNKNOWN [Stylonychia lemnae]|uniref:NAD(P)-binding domain-containing protein n=1 Tax=Stylonychia lemnae TaxID=5949 RepID=A0A078AKY8_STYLE|nr:UNKNOWN [Stylonychia lemnae]|eukprot:CDW82546.1 UNKNOWN [Stylonychia lemnae]